jgi:hypothetical protein
LDRKEKAHAPGPAQTELPKTPGQDNQRRHMAAPQRMQTGVFWTLPLDMIHSEIRFPLLPIML